MRDDAKAQIPKPPPPPVPHREAIFWGFFSGSVARLSRRWRGFWGCASRFRMLSPRIPENAEGNSVTTSMIMRTSNGGEHPHQGDRHYPNRQMVVKCFLWTGASTLW